MPPSITTYRFVKELNGNVLLIGYRGATSVLSVSFQPEKDIRISEEYPFEVVIPVDNSGNVKDFERAKNINVPWERIDFLNSVPSLPNPTSPYDAVDKLGERFFYLVATGAGGVQTVTGNLVNNADPFNPIVDQSVSADANNDTTLGTDGLVFTPQRVQSVTGDTVDNTDPLNPIIKSTANLTFYATNVASGIPTYQKLVTNITDPSYNTIPVNVPTGAISGTGQVVVNLVSGPGVFIGNPGTITINTIGEIRRTSGTGVAEFYYEVYLRNSLGVETLIGTSNNTPPISQSAYTETQASMLFNNGVWTSADSVVIKIRANRIPGGSNPQYDFLFGGTNPFRTLFPVAASVIGDLPIAIGVTTVDGGTNGQVLRVTSGKVGQSELKTVNGQSIFGSGNIAAGVTAEHDLQPPYSYMGTAPLGTLTSSPVWVISRITINLDGSTLVQTATGAWTNRYSLIYT